MTSRFAARTRRPPFDLRSGLGGNLLKTRSLFNSVSCCAGKSGAFWRLSAWFAEGVKVRRKPLRLGLSNTSEWGGAYISGLRRWTFFSKTDHLRPSAPIWPGLGQRFTAGSEAPGNRFRGEHLRSRRAVFTPTPADSGNGK